MSIKLVSLYLLALTLLLVCLPPPARAALVDVSAVYWPRQTGGYWLDFTVTNNLSGQDYIDILGIGVADAMAPSGPAGWRVTFDSLSVDWGKAEYVYAIWPGQSLSGFRFAQDRVYQQYYWSAQASDSWFGYAKATPLPEPSCLLVLGAGAVGLTGIAPRRRRAVT
jgi:hypothetical protein